MNIDAKLNVESNFGRDSQIVPGPDQELFPEIQDSHQLLQMSNILGNRRDRKATLGSFDMFFMWSLVKERYGNNIVSIG